MSHHDRHKSLPSLWIGVLVVAAVISAIAAAQTALRANPEVSFWAEILQQKREAIEPSESPRTFIAGGSSAAFSIHPSVVSDLTGQPTYNLGGLAAMGRRMMIALAFENAQAGDTIVLQIEPELLGDAEDVISPTGILLSRRLGAPDLATGGLVFSENGGSLTATSRALRPGASQLATIAVKMALREPLYRYDVSDYENGVLTTSISQPNTDIEPAQDLAHLPSASGLDDLQAAAKCAEARGITIFYTLPWEAFTPEAVPAMRREHEALLQRISTVMPVLREPTRGAVSDNALFLDTGFHMTLEAGAKRSAALAQSLLEVTAR